MQFGPVFDFFDETLKRQVQTGVVEEATLDDKVLRLLRSIDRMGILDGESWTSVTGTGDENAVVGPTPGV